MVHGIVEKIADALHLPGSLRRGDGAEGATAKPIFDKEKVSVIFVLGGPGAGAPFPPFPSFPLSPPSFPYAPLELITSDIPRLGKGTQCSLLVEKYHFTHLSAGDLLRAEQDRPGSQYGDLIRTYIREGQIVPMEVTIKLLENAMHAAIQSKSGSSGWEDGKGRFLIDGFPRKMDQALKFEEDVRVGPLAGFFLPILRAFLRSLMTLWWCLFSGVHVVVGAVLYDGRGNDVEAVAETR